MIFRFIQDRNDIDTLSNPIVRAFILYQRNKIYQIQSIKLVPNLVIGFVTARIVLNCRYVI